MKKSLLIFTFCFLGSIALIHGQAFNPDSVYHHDSGEKIYLGKEVDVVPEFPGGVNSLFRWLAQNTIYPAEAEEKGIHGKVLGSFIVEVDGTVTDPIILVSADESLDREVIRLFGLLPDFIPGTKDGRNVRVEYNLPVLFSYDDFPHEQKEKEKTKKKKKEQ